MLQNKNAVADFLFPNAPSSVSHRIAQDIANGNTADLQKMAAGFSATQNKAVNDTLLSYYQTVNFFPSGSGNVADIKTDLRNGIWKTAGSGSNVINDFAKMNLFDYLDAEKWNNPRAMETFKNAFVGSLQSGADTGVTNWFLNGVSQEQQNAIKTALQPFNASHLLNIQQLQNAVTDTNNIQKAGDFLGKINNWFVHLLPEPIRGMFGQ